MAAANPSFFVHERPVMKYRLIESTIIVGTAFVNYFTVLRKDNY